MIFISWWDNHWNITVLKFPSLIGLFIFQDYFLDAGIYFLLSHWFILINETKFRGPGYCQQSLMTSAFLSQYVQYINKCDVYISSSLKARSSPTELNFQKLWEILVYTKMPKTNQQSFEIVFTIIWKKTLSISSFKFWRDTLSLSPIFGIYYQDAYII